MKQSRGALPALSLALCLAGGAQAGQQAAVYVDGGAGPVDLPASNSVLYLETVVEHAVGSHPSLRNAAGELLAAGDWIAVARAGYLPQVSAGFGSEYGNRNITGYDSRRVNRFSVSVSQMLYDFGKVSSSVGRADAQRTAAQARVLLAVDDLVRETAHAWTEVQRYEALVEIARVQSSGVTAIADLARERRAKGASPLSDELQAQAREESARANELEVEAELERWRTQLRHLSGLTVLPRTGGELPPAMVDACALRRDALPAAAVLVAQAEQRVAQADVDNARAQTLPTLSLNGSISRGLDGDSRMGESHDATVMLNVSAPLYQGGGNQARRRAAGHGLGAAEAALDHARLSSSQALQDARTRAAGLSRRSGTLEDRTRSIEQTRDLYRQQYLDLGTRSLLDLLNAEQEFHQARQERANNRLDLQRMQVDCLHGSGRLREAFGLEGRQVAGVELVP